MEFQNKVEANSSLALLFFCPNTYKYTLCSGNNTRWKVVKADSLSHQLITLMMMNLNICLLSYIITNNETKSNARLERYLCTMTKWYVELFDVEEGLGWTRVSSLKFPFISPAHLNPIRQLWRSGVTRPLSFHCQAGFAWWCADHRFASILTTLPFLWSQIPGGDVEIQISCGWIHIDN